MSVSIVMDRKEVANTIHAVLASGRALLGKDKLEQSDFGKLKVMKGISNALSSAVTMVQQETAQQRLEVVKDRMLQLGFTNAQAEIEVPKKA